MISVDKSVWDKLKEAPSATMVEIFFYIALNQPETGIMGYRTTKLQLQIDLNMSRTQIFRALKWFDDECLVHELKQVDEVEFMCNPRWVMNNSDFEARKSEWNRRADMENQRKLRLRKERHARKRREERKSQNQQKNPPQNQN